MNERLLLIMAIETARCVEEGVIRAIGDRYGGAVFGNGYLQWTGGALRLINQYELANFIPRAEQLVIA
jgi:3-hydroxyacyl-CoA dehydrogenase/enoyl-CoA hydratase/3-hydroxybutyryl-CoA epimerase